jgi:transposase-like protein
MSQEGVMTQRWKFSPEYKREAAAMLEVPEVTVCQIAADLGIDSMMLRRWRLGC